MSSTPNPPATNTGASFQPPSTPWSSNQSPSSSSESEACSGEGKLSAGLSNEMGGRSGSRCCDVSAIAFRYWLTDRYGSPEKLNDAWGTAFWSQRYASFAEVLPPRRTAAQPNPTQVLDFARFCSDQLLAGYRAERDVLRAHAPGIPVTTNFMITAHQSEQDYFAWAPECDLVAQDHYLDARLPDPHAEQSFACDLTRGVAGGRRGC